MARNEQDMLDILGRVTAETREKQQEAADEGRWRKAFELLISILIWRAIVQAIRLGIVPHMFDVTANAFDLGKGLRSKCARALESMTIDEAPTSKFQKARTLSLVLDGIVDTVGVLDAWTGGDPQEPFFLGVRAIALGQAEAGLELMEGGHWEDVARWRAARAGRPEGIFAKWSIDALPDIQSWIAAKPDISTERLVAKLETWLATYSRSHPEFKAPDRASLRKTLDRMHEKGRLQLPTKIKVGQ